MKNILVFLAIACLLGGFSPAAQAQFWLKKSEREKKKEHRKKEREERRKVKQEKKLKHKKGKHVVVKKKPVPVPPPEPVIVNKSPQWPATTIRSRFRVEVLASLYLDELAKSSGDKVPEKAATGVAFFEGLQLAADSLKRSGFNIDIYIHDAASANESAAMLVKNGKLDSADLIIGAVQAKDVPGLADFAKKKQVNFVSAISAFDGGQKDNPYFTMLEPSLKTHCERITGNIGKEYPGQPVLLLHRTGSVPDENAFRYLTADTSLVFNEVLCNGMPARDSIEARIDTSKTNIVVVSVLETNAADSLLQLLSDEFPGVRFEIFGMPSWYFSRIARRNDYPDINLDITYPFQFDPANVNVQFVNRTCKNNFGQKATEMVYRGFETMFWYANLLKQYGTIFNENYNDIKTAPFTQFEIGLHWDKEGNILFNENTHLSIAKYEGGNKAE